MKVPPDIRMAYVQYMQETQFMSSIHQMARLPQFSLLVEYGDAVIPLCIESLQTDERGMAVLMLLTHITPQDPASNCVTMQSAVDAWVAWSKRTVRA